MANKYPGYCIDCGRNVKTGHGELTKQGGKYVVTCGRSRNATPAKPAKPEVTAPEGMRIADLRISSSNAALNVTFSIAGGEAASFAPYAYARAIKYTRWSDEPLKYSSNPEDVGKSLRDLHPTEAAAQDKACEANEALYAALKSQGQISRDSTHEFTFPLSADEQRACSALVGTAKADLLAAILDGSAEIEVGEVGCDYPHLQILGIKVAGQKVEYALIQTLLGEFGLKVDGVGECKDLAAAILNRQQQQVKRTEQIAAHAAHRAAGFHVVMLKQCWECGRTQILGELDDQMSLVHMPSDVYSACVKEQNEAHKRSLETVPAGTILSSVGFVPADESKFEFRISREHWYCGC